VEHKLSRSYGICGKGGTPAIRNFGGRSKGIDHLVDASSNLRTVLNKDFKALGSEIVD
jgi:hypothetical protein